jgi:hypothetical protein
MDFIEDLFNSEEDLVKPQGVTMADELMAITESYETMVKVYELNRDKISPKKFVIVKDMSYFMRS